MEFKLNTDNSLHMLENNQWIVVELKSCFPDTHPNAFFSIRDEKKREICLLNSLSDLDERNHKIIRAYLERRNFIFEISGIYSIIEEFGVRNFHVLTQAGKRRFQTELDAWPQIQDNVITLIDLYGDHYSFKNLKFGEDLLASYC